MRSLLRPRITERQRLLTCVRNWEEGQLSALALMHQAATLETGKSGVLFPKSQLSSRTWRKMNIRTGLGRTTTFA